jgi:Histidine kinase-, DNA gyrase B-, and HSP90-like ATPase
MANSSNHFFTTNSRVLKDLLTQYKNTFVAFCELVNNSIQADAKKIDITIEYAKTELSATPIKSIVIKDNGNGVSMSEFDKKILEVGTDSKKNGQGVGRFAALQIGSNIEIESVAFDEESKSFTRVKLPIISTSFENKKLEAINIKLDEELLKGKHNNYYQVKIKSLHHNQNHKTDRKNTIAKELLEENIRVSLFERYPYQIFNNTVQFSVNGTKLQKKEFIHQEPILKKETFIDIKGNESPMQFFFYKVKLNDHKAKVFFQIENAGLKSIINTYSYTSEWFSQDMGSWFVYIESPLFTYDLFSNIDMDELGNEGIDKIKSFAKNVITDFFISINKQYENFTHQLRESYPSYNEPKNSNSETQKLVFEQFAFIAEQKFNLLEKNNKIKDVLYPLMEKAISDGNIVYILDSLLKTDKETTAKFKNLLDITDMESVVHFNTEVAEKLAFLDFLHELNYGDIAKHIPERKVLHKIIEKQLWLFGDAYNGIPTILWSDRKLLGIFEEMRQEFLSYAPNEKDENLLKLEGKELNDITDLFFTNEKPLDDGSWEYMIVELKAPNCKISQKELNQIDRYAFAVETKGSIPKHKAKYKLLLISSDFNAFAKSEMDAALNTNKVPFLYKKKKDNIEVYVMSWAELIGIQRTKLSFLSKHLKIKDKSVSQKFEQEYPHLINQKMKTVLKKVS